MSRHSVRSLRNVARVNYKALHQGKGEHSSDMASNKGDSDKEQQSGVDENDLITPEGASGGPNDLGESPHSKPHFGDGYVTADEDLDMMRMEREMRELKGEEKRLTLAAKKDNMRRQLEAQRQKVQNLRGMKPVFVTENTKKSERQKKSGARSRLPASREINSERENDNLEIDEVTIQHLRSDDKLRHKVQSELKKNGLLSAM